jgi:succinate dehydrogenase hydrophobic anchor subunit
MDNAISQPKRGETTWLWLLKIVTGVLVVIILGVHLVVNHLVSPDGLLTFQQVVVYLSNPWVALMEGTFLVLAVFHALLGVRSVILDLHPSQRAIRGMDVVFSVVGVVAIVYGIWLLRAIQAHGVSLRYINGEYKMVGIVIVSHSLALAEGLVQLVKAGSQ